jgi:hypothetical protein
MGLWETLDFPVFSLLSIAPPVSSKSTPYNRIPGVNGQETLRFLCTCSKLASFFGIAGQPIELFRLKIRSSSHPPGARCKRAKEAPFGGSSSQTDQRTGKYQTDSWRVHRRHSARCAPQRQDIPLDRSAGRVCGYCLLGTGIHFRGRQDAARSSWRSLLATDRKKPEFDPFPNALVGKIALDLASIIPESLL